MHCTLRYCIQKMVGRPNPANMILRFSDTGFRILDEVEVEGNDYLMRVDKSTFLADVMNAAEQKVLQEIRRESSEIRYKPGINAEAYLDEDGCEQAGGA